MVLVFQRTQTKISLAYSSDYTAIRVIKAKELGFLFASGLWTAIKAEYGIPQSTKKA